MIAPVWDIFCSVIDNYGDAGVCWRLSRLLATEHGQRVRLWIDHPATFAAINPGVDAGAAVQRWQGVDVHRWDKDKFPEVTPGDVVIEGFGCALPPAYLEAMARRPTAPVWLNLEYLSAEPWVADFHAQPSLHPRLPLTKTFYFPGFDRHTGGLLREKGLAEARDAFQRDTAEQHRHWRARGVALLDGEQRVSLFCYADVPLEPLLESWRRGSRPLRCFVPVGRAAERVARYLDGEANPGAEIRSGALAVNFLAFSDQDDYDRLLWTCQYNFVRGEDSFVRAQWAGQPLAWHIYPQDEGTHLAKLDAFLDRYCAGMPADMAAAFRAFQLAWNGATDADTGRAWEALQKVGGSALLAHARRWAQLLESGPELAAGLVNFARARLK